MVGRPGRRSCRAVSGGRPRGRHPVGRPGHLWDLRTQLGDRLGARSSHHRSAHGGTGGHSLANGQRRRRLLRGREHRKHGGDGARRGSARLAGAASPARAAGAKRRLGRVRCRLARRGGMTIAAGNGTALWYLTRASGVVSLLLLTAGLVLGILGTVRWRSDRWPRFAVVSIHRNLTLFAIAFVALHVLTTIADGYVPVGFKDAVIPFVSKYRPLWLGFGAVAFDLLLALVVTSLLRARIGYRAWRAVHWL